MNGGSENLETTPSVVGGTAALRSALDECFDRMNLPDGTDLGGCFAVMREMDALDHAIAEQERVSLHWKTEAGRGVDAIVVLQDRNARLQARAQSAERQLPTSTPSVSDAPEIQVSPVPGVVGGKP